MAEARTLYRKTKQQIVYLQGFLHLTAFRKEKKEKRKRKRKWVPVDDITSLTLHREKQKQQVARLSKKKGEHRKIKIS